MFRTYKKRDYPVDKIRRFIEPGPIVLVSSQYKGEPNIMTMGWHMVMEFNPSLIKKCYANLIKKYSLFVFKVVKAHVAVFPKNPKTFHYRGSGEFMVLGKSLNFKNLIRD